MINDNAPTSAGPPANRSITVFGLTGGIGCGKSAAADLIRTTHPVLDSDAIARELLESRHELHRAIKDAFGLAVFDQEGRLDRTALADIVFDNDTALQRLNDIVHPHVLREIDQRIGALDAEGVPAVFVESALIFETSIEDMFDYIIAVLASEATVLERLGGSRLAPEDLRRRIARQLPNEEKGARADFIIRNDGSRDDLARAVALVLTIVPALCRIPTS